MRYLRVKNWSEFQHYKDRNPPWIKLHRALLDDYEFARLQDASKAHLMLIWLFASQRDGQIPADPAFLKQKLGLQREPDLKLLIDHGLLVPVQNGSDVLADSKQNAPLEEERREEKKPRRAFALPAWVSSEDWTAFEDSRTKLRKPMTDRARALVLRELEKLKADGHDPRSVLEQSVRRGWLDVFPLKDQPAKPVGEVI